jgi:predicted  nucleic acid-binding Zn-ribbon protein
MLDLLFPYLGATIATAIVVVVATLAFFRHRNSAQNYDALARNLPDACRLQNVKELREQAEKELNDLRDQVSNAKQVLEQKKQAELWLQETKQELLSLTAEREEQERIRLNLSRITGDIERQINRQLELAKGIKASETELAGLQVKERQLQEEVSGLAKRVEGLRYEIWEAEKTASPLRQELAGIRSEISEAQREFQTAQERLQRMVAGLERELQQLQSQRESTQAELKSLQDKLQSEGARLLEVQRQHAELSAQVAGLEAQRESLVQQLEVLREQWKHLRITTGQDEETERNRIAEIWQPAIRVTRFGKVNKSGELDCLEQAHSHLHHLGLSFPRRVLWAFHTSLKVTDISPLVVLAGISGTGKSELPRRYAEAMGLHFLNVAVQPRWDSPQDMFGFFNYLENRYRATELGRALVQMDPFFEEEERGWRTPDDWPRNSLSKHLLLVLLDEMNLARVEYYFSEFLSRLEIRRGIRRDDAGDRRKAEISLEIGSSGGQSPVMNLFVDRNVLFVGTMNEDETTQTLSDKVVDRANVLRFGRPGKLDRNFQSTNGHVQDARLSYATWQTWLRSEQALSPDVSGEVDQWISRLNDALTRVQRPFAFRTQLAMRAYVANYPNQDHDGVAMAMCDQIEQKILPKLRGLDPVDRNFKLAAQEVISVLNDLRDPLLIEAVTSAMKGHQFTWMGVDRLKEESNLAVT